MSWAVVLLWACVAPDAGKSEVTGDTFPELAVTPEHRAPILDRIEESPWSEVYAHLVETAAEPREEGDPSTWDHGARGHNMRVAQANATLAWLHDDAEAAGTALALLDAFPTNWEQHGTWDINIRMVEPLVGFAQALDLLRATPFLTAEDDARVSEQLYVVTSAFYDDYVRDDATRQSVLGFSQNNHPIRTACAIGTAALALRRTHEVEAWLDWAVSEVAYLWGPDGQYVQPDGGVSEGPHYHGFALSPSIAFFVALDNAVADRVFSRSCLNRQDVDPWAGHGCVEGEDFTFENPLYDPTFHATAEWSATLRLPMGWRPPFEDAYFVTVNGGALLPHWGAPEWLGWDWATMEDGTWPSLERSADLSLHHLAYLDAGVIDAGPPEFRSAFLPAAGNAVFRTGWGRDDLWVLLIAEHGSVRKTLHDHVDSTSFTLAAYGEYLLLDPGYYKPVDFDNARTSSPDAHNVVLVDGRGAPDKGLLIAFGDTDAYLENPVNTTVLEYAEAWQSYEGADIERSVAMVRERYLVVADRIASATSDARSFTWRLNGNAGHDAGGTFTVRPDGADWVRETAGVAVHLASTAPGLVSAESPLVEWDAPSVHEFDRERKIGHHGVLDGTVVAPEPGFLAIAAPFRVGDPGGDGPLTVTSVPAPVGVAAWAVEVGGALDIVLLRDPTASTTLTLPTDLGEVQIDTDGELLVVAADRSTALVVRGTSATLDGIVPTELVTVP